jgi:hypothetical protein
MREKIKERGLVHADQRRTRGREEQMNLTRFVVGRGFDGPFSCKFDTRPDPFLDFHAAST